MSNLRKRKYNKRPVIRITADHLDLIALATDVAILFSIWFTAFWGYK